MGSSWVRAQVRPRRVDRDPFGNEPDRELGEWLRELVVAPDQAAFAARLEGTLAGLPSRRSAWDVLGAWAGPRMLAAAMAAAVLLSFSLWTEWRSRLKERVIVPSVSVALIEPRAEPILYAVLEDR